MKKSYPRWLVPRLGDIVVDVVTARARLGGQVRASQMTDKERSEAGRRANKVRNRNLSPERRSELAGIAAPVGAAPPAQMSDKAMAIRRLTHGHLLRVQENIERLRFNTAIAEIRKLSNGLSDAIGAIEDVSADAGLAFAFREGGDVLVNLFAPMMPHLAEECWQALGHDTPIAEAPWPVADAALATNDTVTLPIQINGKKRAEITVDRTADNAAVEAAVLALEAVQKALDGKAPKKIIVVPQRIVNVVA